MDIPENLQTFAEAFDTRSGGCRRTCECGKEFYDACNNYDWEEGEFEALQAMPGDKAVALDYSVSTIMFEGRYYVLDCDCWHKRAENIAGFINRHSSQIVDYLKRECRAGKGGSVIGETAQLVKDTIEHSPAASGLTIAEGLVGWITKEDDFVCAVCVGRVMARGVMLRNLKPVWHDTAGANMLRCAVCRKKPV